jgi:hypothetical protein
MGIAPGTNVTHPIMGRGVVLDPNSEEVRAWSKIRTLAEGDWIFVKLHDGGQIDGYPEEALITEAQALDSKIARLSLELERAQKKRREIDEPKVGEIYIDDRGITAAVKMVEEGFVFYRWEEGNVVDYACSSVEHFKRRYPHVFRRAD